MRRTAAITVVLVLLVGLLAMGCRRRARRQTYTTPYGPPGQLVPAPPPPAGARPPARQAAARSLGGDPAAVLRELDQHLATLGYNRVGPPHRNPNLATGSQMAYRLDVLAGNCYLLAILGDPGTNPTIVVRDPQGGIGGYNVDQGAYPWTLLCPPSSGRYTVIIQQAGPTGGQYLFASYRGLPTQRPNLAGFFGGSVASGPRRVSLDPPTRAQFTSLDRKLAKERYVRVGDPQGFRFQAGQQLKYDLNLEAGRCYAFVSVGAQGAMDTNISLVDGSGMELERDVSPSRDGIVRYCAKQPGRYRLVTHMYSGTGALFTAGYLHKNSNEADTGPVITEAQEAGDLDENFRLLDADMRARGYERMGKPDRGTLREGRSRSFGIELEGGRCYAIMAVADGGIRDLDLGLLDARGRGIDRDMQATTRPIVRVCASETGKFSMRVAAVDGQGDFIYAPYKWPRGTRGPFDLRGLTYVRLAEMTSLLSQEGYEPDPAYTPGKGRLDRQGASVRHELELTGGACYSILVVGGDGVHDLAVRLLSGNTPLSVDETRTSFPNVRHCTEERGTFALEIAAVLGKGEYFYQVFRR